MVQNGMIIDAHIHLGDILEHGGGSLIERQGVRKKRVFDPVSISEFNLHAPFILNNFLYNLMDRWITVAERERNLTATRENMRKSMDEAGVVKSVCLPIPPYVIFEDLKSAAEKDSGILPFTGIDFISTRDIDATLKSHVTAGARGLKLHPILQQVPLNDKRTFHAVECFGQYKLPVLFHCGISSYYLGPEKSREAPEFGEIHYARDLVKAFPGVNFIAGHAGLYEVSDAIAMLGGCGNVWVDISFQSPGIIRKLIGAFGPERVLYGSDWPWGSMTTAVRTVKKACRGDKGLERRIFHENAAELLSVPS
jgi:predicted TIM-barrel fold metal-dependent hydrolase